MKPADFYLGVSEFFAVLVPGFITVMALGLSIKLVSYSALTSSDWITLLLVAYIVGHVLFALGSFWDGLYDRLKPQGNEQLLDTIGELRNSWQQWDCGSINRYQWCRALLSAVHSEGYSEVLRKEADSKLFRSLIAPLLVSSIGVAPYWGVGWSLVLLVMAVIAFWRYRGQRFKACTLAYTHVIVLQQAGRLSI